MLKRMPITVPTGEGMSYRKGLGGRRERLKRLKEAKGASAAGG